MARSGLVCAGHMICAVVGGWLRKVVVGSLVFYVFRQQGYLLHFKNIMYNLCPPPPHTKFHVFNNVVIIFMFYASGMLIYKCQLLIIALCHSSWCSA